MKKIITAQEQAEALTIIDKFCKYERFVLISSENGIEVIDKEQQIRKLVNGESFEVIREINPYESEEIYCLDGDIEAIILSLELSDWVG